MSRSQQLGFAAVAGVASHVLHFINGEFHIRAPTVARFYFISFAILSLLEFKVLERPFYDALVLSSLVASVYVSALFTSILIYRAFFHRLRNFPGPPLAKLSKFYHAYKVRDFQQCIWLHDVHKKYGDFVRTGPSEITCFTPDAIPAILGAQSKCGKSMWWEMMWPEVSMVTTRDQKMHDSRRRAWDRGFSIAGKSRAMIHRSSADGKPALKAQEPYLSQFVEQLCILIASKQGQTVDFTEIFSLFAFDVMGDINFGYKFNMIKNGKMSDWLANFKEGMFLFGPFTPLPWLFHLAIRIPGMQKDWLAFKTWSDSKLRERLAIKPEKKDMMSHAIEHAESDPVLGAENRHHWLLSDFITLVLAARYVIRSSSIL